LAAAAEAAEAEITAPHSVITQPAVAEAERKVSKQAMADLAVEHIRK
jgi:hypothetical protein